MYRRIMNKLDADMWQKKVQGTISDDVIGRVREQINILDEAYGSTRGSHDMGGYIHFFDDKASYDENIDEILAFYNIDKDLYEYSDCISEGQGTSWMEELYMLGSDDALVLIHPYTNEKRRGYDCLIAKNQSTKLKV